MIPYLAPDLSTGGDARLGKASFQRVGKLKWPEGFSLNFDVCPNKLSLGNLGITCWVLAL